jgi:signal transduction histidine kinase/ketosteroid isomerase-like protein/ATP:corrinoid adenosyltransferase
MKLTSKLEAEILKVYHAYWDAYLKGDMKTFASFLDDNISVVGTAVSEVFANKKETVRFYKATADQMTGKAQFRNRKIRLQQMNDAVLTNEQSDLYILIDEKWTFYSHARISVLFQQTKSGWKLVHQHGSFPDSRTEEGDQIAAEQIKEENLQLREAVKRLTVELESKNRELEIETAPDDMLEVCQVISQQSESLGIKEIRNVQTAIIYEDKGTYLNYEYYTKHNKLLVTEVDYKNHELQSLFANRMLQGAEELFAEALTGKEVSDWYEYQKTTNQFADSYLENAQSLNYYFYSLGPVALGMSTYVPLSDEEISLFKRFRNVFDLAYRRFLDIQKAEEQAREAQIELALERVRAGAMAMRQSDELSSLIFVLYQELTKLDARLDRCFLMIVNHENKGITWWMAGQEGLLAENGFFVQMNEHPSHLMYLDYCKQQKKKWTYLFQGKEKRDWDRFGFSKTELTRLPEPVKAFMAAAKQVHLSGSSDQFGSLVTGSFEPLPEEQQDIISRFTVAFNQAFIRFLDLQKAEELARESQIEVALEKVRSRSMGMQKSNELKEVIQIVYNQLVQLKLPVEHTGFILDYKNRNDYNSWIADHLGSPSNIIIPYFKAIYYDRFNEAKRQGLNFLAVNLNLKEKNKFYRDLFKHLPGFPETSKDFILNQPALTLSTVLLEDVALYIENFSGKPFSDVENETLMRFGKVFQQSYTRFLDLQKAEAQAREAQIEAALEKVRSRSLAMHKPNEIVEVAVVLRNEMASLGVEELETSSIYLVEARNHSAECWYAIKDVRGKKSKLVSDEMTLDLKASWVGEQMLKFFQSKEKQASIVMKGENRKQWISYCASKSKVLKRYYGNEIPERTYHLLKFANGFMGAASPGEISNESWNLLQRATAVFSLAYTRFLDLQKAEAHALQAEEDLIAIKAARQKAEEALAELQVTQKQLIQSEKMASLGELTAGIAHEIQNPLNFVNNFSEVSNELIVEIEEERAKKPETRDEKLVTEILIDIKQNLEKINHHGKRADAIVKGMLQHSRSSSGVKEPTDINALADEYLRLAYHGLRAKDKSFNATLKTDFDETIGNINVIPQDIGRVILNLITNAFYAVDEKKKQLELHTSGVSNLTGFQNLSGLKPYEPTVTVSTEAILPPPAGGGPRGVKISVKDNGPGIPQKVLDKIFQPFFTTKPTGQGTGLGLSLAYDIVKAHGGELKVATKEGEGTEFTIQLPL